MKREECIKLIKSFIDERLNGNIWNFLHYDLDLLENDQKYGGHDPDNSKIANAIYVVLWGNKISNLSMEHIGSFYRGDTLNSFHTLMGFPAEDSSTFLGIQKYTDNENIIAMAKQYHKKYHTLGNMMIWPNRAIEFNNQKFTINTLRSHAPWYDYFDSFLEKLKQELTNPAILSTDATVSDLIIRKLISENNYFFGEYSELNSASKFKEFIHTFYLEKYVNPITLDIIPIFYPHAYHWNSSYTKEAYEQYVVSYISHATEIIDDRCSCMIKDLDTILKNYDNHPSRSKPITSSDNHNIRNFFSRTLSNIRQKKYENISYILLFSAAIIILTYTASIYIRFLCANGYNTLLKDSLNRQYPGNRLFENGITYIIFLSALFMSFSYKKTHHGIKKIIMIPLIILQIILLVFPFTTQLILKIVGNSKMLMEKFPNQVNILFASDDILYLIYFVTFTLGIIIPFFMFIFEEQYRKFVKYWGFIFGMFFFGIPIILTILSYKILAILCGIIIIAYFSLIFFQDIHYAIICRCPTCKKLSGLQYIDCKLFKEEKISIKVENAKKNADGHIIGTYEQYIPGTRKIYIETYKCKFCGHVQTKTITKNVSSL